ncbi:MAG: hypothetical protein U7123_25025 [Potamolinea sp.]
MEWTAAEILKLVFEAVIETGALKLTESAIAKARQLWEMIRHRLQGDERVQTALVEIDQHRSWEHLKEIELFLQVEMYRDRQFAETIKTLAEEIKASDSQDTITMNVDAHDNSAVVGKAEGKNQNFGGTHVHHNHG